MELFAGTSGFSYAERQVYVFFEPPSPLLAHPTTEATSRWQ